MDRTEYFYSSMNMKNLRNNYHWMVWILSVFYSLICFKKSAEKNFFMLNRRDFDDGWAIINRPKDVTDFEWVVLFSTFKKFWPVLFFQILLSAFIRKVAHNMLPIFYSLFSILSLTLIVGDKAALFFVIYITIMFFTHVFGQKSYCYLLTACALVFKNSSYVSSLKVFAMDSEIESFLFDVGLTWIMAKSLSFMCDRINLNAHKCVTLYDFSLVVSYCLYLPTVFTGPILSYEPFVIQLDKSRNQTSKTFYQKCITFAYILTCSVIFEVMLHFIYSSCIQYYPDVASKFDSWSLCGLGYALPVMFFFKYFIIYSIAGSIASFENFEFPPPPKCISCIHLSSYLWRHFDRGLYLWILSYLYHPLMQGKYNLCKRMCAVAASFAFVCLWHNVDRAVCMWTFLNFILVMSEMLMHSALSSQTGKRYLPAFLFKKEYYGALTTPHFILMCISSTFFLSNWDIGILLYERVLLTGLIPFIPIMFIMYCGARVSIDVREWEKHQCYYSSRLKWSFFRK